MRRTVATLCALVIGLYSSNAYAGCFSRNEPASLKKAMACVESGNPNRALSVIHSVRYHDGRIQDIYKVAKAVLDKKNPGVFQDEMKILPIEYQVRGIDDFIRAGQILNAINLQNYVESNGYAESIPREQSDDLRLRTAYQRMVKGKPYEAFEFAYYIKKKEKKIEFGHHLLREGYISSAVRLIASLPEEDIIREREYLLKTPMKGQKNISAAIMLRDELERHCF